ncbi:MAG: hypothetical protein LC623_05345 [Halobacteriales archaeon]|nr:hypothetical protein [Halobacteriales archaeon]
MTVSFESAAEALEQAARAFRLAAEAPNKVARDNWLRSANDSIRLAKRLAARAASAQLVGQNVQAANPSSAPTYTLRERIMLVLPDDAHRALPVRDIIDALADQPGGVTFDKSRVRHLLRDLEGAGKVKAGMLKGSRVETRYWRTTRNWREAPPPLPL